MSRSARRGAASGGLIGLALFAWVLFEGRFGLARPRYTTNFFDLQGRAFLAGRLDIRPVKALGIEAIMTGRRAYVYFGPVPSIIRLPVLALTHRFDGRLGQPSMLLAAMVLAWALARLVTAARLTLRGTDQVSHEAWWTATWVVIGLCGTVVVYLGSLSLAYHEAILWGIALALVAYDALVRFMLAPSTRRAVLVGATAGVAFLTRASIGMGPVVAAGLLAVVALWRAWHYRQRPTPDEIGRQWWRLGIGTGLGIVIYVALNLARFHTLYQLPLDRQVYSHINASRKATLAANGGSLFGLKFMPTALLQYLRPDNLRLVRSFPYVDFGHRATVLGGVTFDTVSRSSSLTVTTPVFVAAALIGIAVLLRRRGATLAVWVLPLVGAALGTVAALDIAFIAHRYLGDLLPAVVLPAAIGWAWIATSPVDPTPGRRRVRRLGLGLVGVLACWSVFANVGLAILQQRGYSARTPADLAGFVSRQLDWPGSVVVTRSDALDRAETTAEDGALRIVGSCDALYRSDGEAWILVEGGTTRYRLNPGQVADTTRGRPLIERHGDRVLISGDSFRTTVAVPTGPATVDVVSDRAADTIEVVIDRRVVFSLDGGTGADADPSTAPVGSSVAGSLLPTPVCDRVQRLGGASS